jgi:hypothetical protein
MKQVVADLSPPQTTWQERGTSPPLIQPQLGGSPLGEGFKHNRPLARDGGEWSEGGWGVERGRVGSGARAGGEWSKVTCLNNFKSVRDGPDPVTGTGSGHLATYQVHIQSRIWFGGKYGSGVGPDP